jgi:hypothetical protein
MVKRNYLGPSPMFGQNLRTAYVRLRDEAGRCPPGSPLQLSIYETMASLAKLHREVTGRVIAEPGQVARE